MCSLLMPDGSRVMCSDRLPPNRFVSVDDVAIYFDAEHIQRADAAGIDEG